MEQTLSMYVDSVEARVADLIGVDLVDLDAVMDGWVFEMVERAYAAGCSVRGAAKRLAKRINRRSRQAA